MSQTLYGQLVHFAAVVAVSVLVGLGKIDSQTGIALIAGLVGLALPSPYSPPTTISAAPVVPLTGVAGAIQETKVV